MAMKAFRPALIAGVCVVGAIALGLSGLAIGQERATPSAPTPEVPTPAQLLTEPLPTGTPNADQVARGRYLVVLGDCVSCHTRDGGQPLAGGLAMNTPLGRIYTANLTSDPDTGVGAWTPDQFYAALHEGVGDHGKRLYPAFPYVFFTHIPRGDSDAILAYLKTTPAVRYTPPANRLPFPLNFRFVVRGWNLLFFHPGVFQSDAAKSAQWNRGAYIVNGPGHCSQCHTQTNFFGANEPSRFLQGGVLDNWTAPDLTENSRTGLGQWTAADIVAYLKTGRNARAQAGGSMAEVVSYSTSMMSNADLDAVADYLKDQPASPWREPPEPTRAAMARGAEIYEDACASCHLMEGAGQPGFFPPLKGDTAAQQTDPTGLVHLILAGVRTAPTPTRPTPLSMPSFAWKLSDEEIADVSTFIRNSWGNRAPPTAAGQVRRLRSRLGLNTVHLTASSGDHS